MRWHIKKVVPSNKYCNFLYYRSVFSLWVFQLLCIWTLMKFRFLVDLLSVFLFVLTFLLFWGVTGQCPHSSVGLLHVNMNFTHHFFRFLPNRNFSPFNSINLEYACNIIPYNQCKIFYKTLGLRGRTEENSSGGVDIFVTYCMFVYLFVCGCTNTQNVWKLSWISSCLFYFIQSWQKDRDAQHWIFGLYLTCQNVKI